MKRIKPTTDKGKRMMLTILIALLGCLLILFSLLLAYSPGKPQRFLQRDGTVLADSVSEKNVVTIGGVDQGMFIRGKNIQNPVLLFLHGGPGIFSPKNISQGLRSVLRFAIGSSAAEGSRTARTFRRKVLRRNNS